MTKTLHPAPRADALFVLAFALRKYARPGLVRQPDWQDIVAGWVLDHMTMANLVVMQGQSAPPPQKGYGATLEEQARERRENEQAQAARRVALSQG